MIQVCNKWSVVLLASICCLVQGLSRIDPLVSTNSGLIRGLRSAEGHATFLGVPYGVLDENNLFGAATPHPGFDDIFEAYEPNECPQVINGIPTGTIDCLTMNIYVPSTASSRNRLPVMVWIHGGSFVIGSAITEGREPSPLLKHDVIVVGINYRIGVYGFMCLDIPEVPGNQGLKDQVLALRWIKENIEAFGGDANQITLFGESAGGMSVNLHLLSANNNLFQKVIIQSGPAVSPWMIIESNTSIPLIMAEALDFSTEDLHEALEFLSSINPKTLVKLFDDIYIANVDYSDEILAKPCIEQEFEGVESFLAEHPTNIRSIQATNIMIGGNADEMAFIYERKNADFFSNFKFDTTLNMAFELKDFDIEDIRHFYIGDESVSEDVKREIIDFSSDILFNYPMQKMAEQLLRNGARTVYRYLFSYVGSRNYLMNANNLNLTAATHADELGYLFNIEQYSEESTPEDQLLVDRLTTLWTNFAKYGDPTPETSELLPVKWETITRTTQPYLEIDSDLTLKSRPFNSRMAFWDLFYKLHADEYKWNENSRK